jgi:hypothetical protein
MPTQNNKNESGQSTIEFLLTFAFAIGLSFLFVSLALNKTTGFLVHYATFMSGRAFMSYDASSNTVESNLNSAERVAKDVFKLYGLNRFGVQQNQVKVQKPKPVGNVSNLMSGVTAQFQKKLTPYKLVGGGTKATFLSEGFLGKEPLRVQCWEMICRAMGIAACGTQAEMDITVFDNGC